jgi:hypothetical protein
MGTVLGMLLDEANYQNYGFFIVLADPTDSGDAAGIPFALSNVKREGMTSLVMVLMNAEKRAAIFDCADHNYDRLAEKLQELAASAERRAGIKEH